MNDLTKKPDVLSGFIKRPKLSDGQKALYKLFCDALEGKIDRVTKPMVFDIYKGIAIGESSVGGYSTHKGEWVPSRDEPWEEWQWNRNFINWFKNALGALICKGYCTVIPVIDFRDADENCIKTDKKWIPVT
jgi:hypothetical protein